MSSSSESSEIPESVRTIRHLVRLMHKYDVTAIDIGEGPSKIRLRRKGEMIAPAAPGWTSFPMPPAPATSPMTAAPSVPQAPSQPATPVAPTPAGAVIESPMVGTFYAAVTPDSPSLVSPGSAVRPETPVCVIEAMKVFTEIPAGISGTIAECLVKNGQAVEFGQPLFRLQP